jgi:hypothetical protein
MWRDKTNKTWMDAEWQKYLDTNTGYYTSYADNHMTLLTGPQLFGDKLDPVLSRYRDEDPAKYLRPGTSEPVKDAYRRLVNLTIDSIATGQVAVAEFIGLSRISVLVKPLSWGYVDATSANIFDEPAVAHRTFSHPLDLDVVLASLKMSRRMLARPEMAPLSPIETNPGLKVQGDEELVAWIRANMNAGAAHGCCAVPRGTVLDSGFSVKGMQGLRVVDTSSWPMIPGAHASQVCEKKLRSRVLSGFFCLTESLLVHCVCSRRMDCGENPVGSRRGLITCYGRWGSWDARSIPGSWNLGLEEATCRHDESCRMGEYSQIENRWNVPSHAILCGDVLHRLFRIFF